MQWREVTHEKVTQKEQKVCRFHCNLFDNLEVLPSSILSHRQGNDDKAGRSEFVSLDLQGSLVFVLFILCVHQIFLLTISECPASGTLNFYLICMHAPKLPEINFSLVSSWRLPLYHLVIWFWLWVILCRRTRRRCTGQSFLVVSVSTKVLYCSLTSFNVPIGREKGNTWWASINLIILSESCWENRLTSLCFVRTVSFRSLRVK
jgi:hypothetical protein